MTTVKHKDDGDNPMNPTKILNVALRIVALSTFSISLLLAQSTTTNPPQKEKSMMQHASGAFDVKVIPQKPDNDQAKSANFGRMSLDKQFHGDLEATSKGEMLSAMTEIKGSAGYVAMERVTGTLQGRTGTFVLQHNASMNRGVPQLSITVVPDSGTGELTGISGTMNIIIKEDGKHFYDFEYSLTQ